MGEDGGPGLTKTQDAVAQHLAHSNPGPVPKGLEMIPLRVHIAKQEQWEVDCLMVMDALSMGGGPGKKFNRGDFLRKIDRQFKEDEACRSGDAPVDDPTVSSSST